MKTQRGYALVRAWAPVRWSRLAAMYEVLRRWRQLARERDQLARLDLLELKDLGLTRADVMQESERPFWDDPLRK
ncbi:conserved hypothetical protein [Pseudomonas sp. 8Z]|uniref:DUF1127 domain-containing protein n=1 Tax=Pseudomonas sp. 8Z TaxID=2653166 RepID=UPI0012F02EFC|nr:DUF1127 domain-containing protein [Pseudomonas sp. 8Z]VXD02175.1 conserved hypothetical protein [Pseudomonas sp. 8Z]